MSNNRLALLFIKSLIPRNFEKRYKPTINRFLLIFQKASNLKYLRKLPIVKCVCIYKLYTTVGGTPVGGTPLYIYSYK